MKRVGWTLLTVCVLAACSDTIDLEPCDIRDEECQQSVFLAVQRVRGAGWDPWLDMPPTRVITQAQFRAELEAQRDEEAALDPPYDHMEAALRLLQLVGPSTPSSDDEGIDSSVSNVAAYYDSRAKDVTVIDRGTTGDVESATFILAHELVHAAQDRDIVLDDWYRSDTVSGVQAKGALVEGEAMLYANLVFADINGASPLQLSFTRYHADMLDDARARVEDAASPWYELSGLFYPLGSRYVTDTWLRDGNVAVRGLFADPPRDVVQMFSFPGSGTDHPAAPFPCVTPIAPDGFEIVRETMLGAVVLFAFATRSLPAEEAWELASTWRGDRFVVYGNADQHTVLVWQVTLGASGDLESIALDLFGADAVVHDDKDVRILLTDVPTPLAWNAWRDCTSR